MKSRRMSISVGLALALLVLFGIGVDTFAQGRGGGRGNGGGRPANAGRPIESSGVDRGLGTASRRSDGRSDDGLRNASTRSNGRSDRGLERARAASIKAASMSDHELARYRGLSRKLGTTPEQLRAAYEAALVSNPNLKYGQFVAAHVVSDNLNGRYPRVTSSAILAGLANGDSLGETLRELRVPADQARAAERDAKRKLKAAKDRD